MIKISALVLFALVAVSTAFPADEVGEPKLKDSPTHPGQLEQEALGTAESAHPGFGGLGLGGLGLAKGVYGLGGYGLGGYGLGGIPLGGFGHYGGLGLGGYGYPAYGGFGKWGKWGR